MPYDVPAAHMEQVLEVKEWFETYYAKYPEVEE
jgi:hypothetical protein